MLSVLAVGHAVGGITEVESEAEWRKKITAELDAGVSFHLIDNVEQPLASPQLASLLTTQVWRDRLL